MLFLCSLLFSCLSCLWSFHPSAGYGGWAVPSFRSVCVASCLATCCRNCCSTTLYHCCPSSSDICLGHSFHKLIVSLALAFNLKNCSKRCLARYFAPSFWEAKTYGRHTPKKDKSRSQSSNIYFFAIAICLLIGSVTVQKNLHYLRTASPPPSVPSEGALRLFFEGKSRSLVPRFTACPKQMGDSGNWHEELWARCDGSLSKDTASPPFALAARRAAANAKVR